MAKAAAGPRLTVSDHFDIAIVGGTVVDGTGGPRFRADLGVRGDRVACIGELSSAYAETTIDASGLVVAPGLIDSHTHSEATVLNGIDHASLHQGITTQVVGQDGFGIAPTTSETAAFMSEYLCALCDGLPSRALSVSDLLAEVNGRSTANVATLIPNGCVRLLVVGNTRRRATSAELVRMGDICVEGMAQGALGLSSGLDYVPSGFAGSEELAALCRVISRSGGVYVTHVRYREGLKEALREAADIAVSAGCPLHISHLRPDHVDFFTADEIIGQLDAAEQLGVSVSFDLYPYTYGCTMLALLLPIWMMEGTLPEVRERLRSEPAWRRAEEELGDGIQTWAEVELAGTLESQFAGLVGTDVLTAAAICGRKPVEFVCRLIVDHDFKVLILDREVEEESRFEQVQRLLCDERHIFGSDAVFSSGRSHPRTFGAAARLLGPFVRETHDIGLEQAVHHCTGRAAERFGLESRGYVRSGCFADLAIFDPAALSDRATKWRPETAVGVETVIVNGEIVLLDGVTSGATPGRGLMRGSVASR
jgi:N-acyl-D-amino-acid deacylase